MLKMFSLFGLQSFYNPETHCFSKFSVYLVLQRPVKKSRFNYFELSKPFCWLTLFLLLSFPFYCPTFSGSLAPFSHIFQLPLWPSFQMKGDAVYLNFEWVVLMDVEQRRSSWVGSVTPALYPAILRQFLLKNSLYLAQQDETVYAGVLQGGEHEHLFQFFPDSRQT